MVRKLHPERELLTDGPKPPTCRSEGHCPDSGPRVEPGAFHSPQAGADFRGGYLHDVIWGVAHAGEAGSQIW
jgi:hypothetical protein